MTVADFPEDDELTEGMHSTGSTARLLMSMLPTVAVNPRLVERSTAVFPAFDVSADQKENDAANL